MRKVARGFGALWQLARKSPSWLKRYRFPKGAERQLRAWSVDGPVPAATYEDLFGYFATGWATYRTADGSRAAYPGLPSWSGHDVDGLEGFARIMPLFAAWCHSGRDEEIELLNGRRISLPEEFREGLLAGTDPSSSGYWGDMPGKSNQRIVEAADIALALWLFRDTVWEACTASERERIVEWLSLLEGRPGLDNNWHLFFVLVDRVLAALGHPHRISGVSDRYERVKEFHVGDGWFEDGPGGPVDYYNSWGFHYALHWIDQIDPEWDPTFIRTAQREFLSGYKYLMTPDGLPILGRSIPYRMAAAAPLVFGHVVHPDVVSVGEARRALDSIWRYFIRHGAVRHGTVTQGYFGADARLVDPYSGPASPLWALRSLVAAFVLPRSDSFWSSAGDPLPVEQTDYELVLGGPQWLVRGERAAGTVSVELLANPADGVPELEPFPVHKVLLNFATGRPERPTNEAAKYGRRQYRSDRPFCR